jgi:hypothetical protein
MLRQGEIRRFLESLRDSLRGDWILLGGSYVAVVLDPERGTEDIDLVPKDPEPQSRLQLMKAAERAGLSVEAVNSAADFFLRRIEGWETMLEVLYQWSDLTILVPQPQLFLLLKLERMSEADLEDCRLVLERHAGFVDRGSIIRRLQELNRKETNPAARARRSTLLRQLKR